MLTIRLSRIGKKKKPMYRLVISEKARDPYGRALEILGSYNPFTKELTVKKDRVEYWLKNGAKMSVTVNNLLIEKEIIKADKVRAYSPKKKKEEVKPAAPEKKAKPAAEAKSPSPDSPQTDAGQTEPKKPVEEIKEEPKTEAKEETKETVPQSEGTKEEPKTEAKEDVKEEDIPAEK